MSNMINFLLRSRHGVLRVILFTSAVMLLAGLVCCYPGIQSYITIKSDPSFIERHHMSEGYRFYADGCIAPAEIASLAAAAAAFWFLCDAAFRFATANGASRKSVMTSLTAGLLPVAIVTAAICQGIRIFFELATPFFEREWENDIYHNIFDDPQMLDSFEEFNYFSYAMRDVAAYFLIMIVVFATVLLLYGAYRRYGTFGILCAILAVMTVAALLSLVFYAEGRASTNLGHLFIDRRLITENYGDGVYKYYFTTPRPAAFIITAAAYLAASWASFGLLIRRAGIKASEPAI